VENVVGVALLAVSTVVPLGVARAVLAVLVSRLFRAPRPPQSIS
jgi:hypothetical protein